MARTESSVPEKEKISKRRRDGEQSRSSAVGASIRLLSNLEMVPTDLRLFWLGVRVLGDLSWKPAVPTLPPVQNRWLK